jgi:hypothetical protein
VAEVIMGASSRVPSFEAQEISAKTVITGTIFEYFTHGFLNLLILDLFDNANLRFVAAYRLSFGQLTSLAECPSSILLILRFSVNGQSVGFTLKKKMV